MTSLPPAIRRFLALALLLIGVPAALLVVILPVTSRLQELRAEIEAERELLGRFGQVARQESRAAELEKAGEAAARSDVYLKGESEAIKAAGLQRLLAELAAGDRVRLHTTRALEARERGGVKLIGVRVQFQAEIEQVRALLYRIESARPFLFLEAVQIHPIAAFAPGDTEQKGVLDVRFDVFGAVAGQKAS